MKAQQLAEIDPLITPFLPRIRERAERLAAKLAEIDTHGGLHEFSSSYKRYGFSVERNCVVYREWVPNAARCWLVGEFNSWDRGKHEMQNEGYGVFAITIQNELHVCPIAHNSKVKISILLKGTGEQIERVPAWIKQSIQDLNTSVWMDGVFWNPPATQEYIFKHPKLIEGKDPNKMNWRIYEAHVGIASNDPVIATYKYFTANIIPRVSKLGYNAIQLMAIMEHPYYASFGYQVTSFFAPSSRFGTPEDLKELIDTAHLHGIAIFLDVVHSHASKNVADGISFFDGTDHQYFHSGERGIHSLWDSRVFNYGNIEVLRFLLSNLRYWIETFQFDGFRFDGVTSMLYLDHGTSSGFNSYEDYFNGNVDEDAILYLQLANHMFETIYAGSIVSIAEDVSGMPTLCRPDHEWDMKHIVHHLTNRRWKEDTISYAESHDQALVGDKTIAFRLMDAEMYTNMSDLSELTPVISRGLSLHKLIRMITFAIGGEGYLNFMGNEFAHPEWLDFPRVGNNSSYHYARRQFNLVDDVNLRYKYMNSFDGAMQHLEQKYPFFHLYQYVSKADNGDKVIVCERGTLLFVFNFHPTQSFVGYRVGTPWKAAHRIVLDSDATIYGGFERVDKSTEFLTADGWDGRAHSIQVYIPSRCVLVFKADE